MADQLTDTFSAFSSLLEDRPEAQKFRIDRAMFLDPELFEIEMKKIFEGSWIYLAHESQLPGPNDYYTTFMGRQPVIVSRNDRGELRGFINTCMHRGATLCREGRGNKKTFDCHFHGWCYDSDGHLVSVPGLRGADYPEDFKLEKHGLRRVPKLASYRGFIFGSLSADVPTLDEHLAESRAIIDVMVDQSPQGLEVLKGSSTYTFDANWKMQAENGVDGYHVATVHRSYVATIMRRAKIMAGADKTRAMNVGKFGATLAGFMDLGQGHVLLWSDWSDPENRPGWPKMPELTEKFGAARAKWMISRAKNLCLYPNVFLMDQMSSQIRVYRPLAVDKTEVTIYCFAPVGVDKDARRQRIRQYEDFFNASGMATPDDLAEFEATQLGSQGRLVRWHEFNRGLKHLTKGADQFAKELGIEPLHSGANVTDEAIFHAQYRQWRHLLQRPSSSARETSR
jgi:benzoate/toluate 1,2-dioxygenase alpha subunit